MMMFVKGSYSWLSTVGWGKNMPKEWVSKSFLWFLKDSFLKITWMDGICTFALRNPGNSPPVSLFLVITLVEGRGIRWEWIIFDQQWQLQEYWSIQCGQSIFFWKCWRFPKFNLSHLIGWVIWVEVLSFRILQEANYTGPSFIDAVGGKKSQRNSNERRERRFFSCKVMSGWQCWMVKKHMGVSENRGTPKSSILIGFSIINHPFWSTLIFGNTHIFEDSFLLLATTG